jgi:hypothetical protein
LRKEKKKATQKMAAEWLKRQSTRLPSLTEKRKKKSQNKSNKPQ